MVHYDTSSKAAPTPPPLCPKCGSHRTVVVGKSNDGAILIVRCNVCGERSEVSSSDQTKSDDVAEEIDAMAQIGRALSSLHDAQARARVLRWATERFHVDTTPPVVASTVRADAPAADPSLEIDALNEFFPDTARAIHGDDAPAPEPAQASGIESMVRGFAADFRRFALEWQGA